MCEVWKQFRDTIYSVSTFGKVRNDLTNRELKHGLKGKRNERPFVNLGRKNPHYIHRMVAETFIPNPRNKPQVNHLDGDPTNNNVNNLEWCTIQENIEHAVKNGLNYRKFTNKDIILMRLMRRYNIKQKHVAVLFSCSVTTVRAIEKYQRYKYI